LQITCKYSLYFSLGNGIPTFEKKKLEAIMKTNEDIFIQNQLIHNGQVTPQMFFVRLCKEERSR
jgi:hypothetical protein